MSIEITLRILNTETNNEYIERKVISTTELQFSRIDAETKVATESMMMVGNTVGLMKTSGEFK